LGELAGHGDVNTIQRRASAPDNCAAMDRARGVEGGHTAQEFESRENCFGIATFQALTHIHQIVGRRELSTSTGNVYLVLSANSLAYFSPGNFERCRPHWLG